MNPSSTTTLPGVPLRQDASVIGLVGIAHLVSHFSQLLLAPLFPWLKTLYPVWARLTPEKLALASKVALAPVSVSSSFSISASTCASST